MSDEILKVENLSKNFWIKEHILSKKYSVNVLKDISFSLKLSQTLAILGSSGSGKSTLAKLISMLDKPSNGKIWLFGKDSTTLLPQEIKGMRKDIQMIFQNQILAFNPKKSVKAHFKDVIRNFDLKFSANELENLLKRVGLDKSVINKFPRELSGGMATKVSIARALMVRPRLLICDEITSGLDFISQKMVLNLLKYIKNSSDIAFIFITHDIKTAKFLSDDVLILEDKKMKFFGKFKDANLQIYENAMLNLQSIPSNN